jgi:hypothetical protein
MEDDFKYYDDYSYFREYPDAPDYTEMMDGMQLAMADTGRKPEAAADMPSLPEVVVTGQPEPEFKKIEPAGGMGALKAVGEAIQSGAEKIDFDVLGFPGIGTLTLKDLTVGDLGKVLVNIAEGFPPVEFQTATGRLKVPRPTMESLELINAAPAVTGAVKLGKKVMKKRATKTAAALGAATPMQGEEQK